MFNGVVKCDFLIKICFVCDCLFMWCKKWVWDWELVVYCLDWCCVVFKC